MGVLHKRESACGLGVPLFVGLRSGFLTVLVVTSVLRPASRMFEDRTYPNFRPASCVLRPASRMFEDLEDFEDFECPRS